MDQVVAEAGLPWLETPDQAVVWGTALGLHAEIENVLERSLDDQRDGRVAAGSTWIPAWYSTGAGGRGFASGDFAGAGSGQRQRLLELRGAEPRRDDGGPRDDRELAGVVRIGRRWRRVRRRRLRRRWRRLGRRLLAGHAAAASRSPRSPRDRRSPARPAPRPGVPTSSGPLWRALEIRISRRGPSGGSAAGTGQEVIGTSIRKSSSRRRWSGSVSSGDEPRRGDGQRAGLRQGQRDHRAEHRLRRRQPGPETERGADRVPRL